MPRTGGFRCPKARHAIAELLHADLPGYQKIQ